MVKNATAGTFYIRLYNESTGRYRDLPIAPVYFANGAIDPNATRDSIQATLNADVEELGINWPTDKNSGGRADYNGPVTVRLMSDQEVTDRQGTYWDLGSDVTTAQYVYEISFMGEVHNTEIDLSPSPGNWNGLKVGTVRRRPLRSSSKKPRPARASTTFYGRAPPKTTTPRSP